VRKYAKRNVPNATKKNVERRREDSELENVHFVGLGREELKEI
jgi:hypothetical protein